MREATDEAAKWIDDNWKESSDNSYPYYCMYEDGKYPYFTFMNKETHEQVCLWSDLFIHDTITNTLIAPDGSWGKYYDIPLTVFEKACELHKEKSNKFVRQYRDLVYAKTGITFPIKEYTPAEIEEEQSKIEEMGKALRAELEAMAKLRS